MVEGVTSHLESNAIPPEMLRGLTRSPRAHQDLGKGAVTPRPAFECLRVSCRGMGQQWPVTETEALAAADLGGTVCGIKSSWRTSTLAPPYEQMTHKLENNCNKDLALLQKF